jgi:hypothetical protein
MKMMLSIPKTISRKVNVNRAIKHQDLKILPFCLYELVINRFSRRV